MLSREKAKIFPHFKGIRRHQFARELWVERIIAVVDICSDKVREQSASTFYPPRALPRFVLFAAQAAVFSVNTTN